MNPVLRELGFSSGDRVALVHADDVGMCHATLPAMEELFDVGVVTSASVMVPCPAFADVGRWRRKHPQADLGVHLTLTSELANHRWRPLSTHSLGSGLVDDGAYFHATTAALCKAATRAAVRIEMETQLEIAERAGLAPTHLDSHMYAALCGPFVEDYVQLGFGRAMPVFLPRALGNSPSEQHSQRLRTPRWERLGMPVFDKCEVVTRQSRTGDGAEYVRDVFNRLSAGLTCILLHPAADTAEIRSIAPDWQSRVVDFNVFRDPRLRTYVNRLGIHLISYQDLRTAMQARLSN